MGWAGRERFRYSFSMLVCYTLVVGCVCDDDLFDDLMCVPSLCVIVDRSFCFFVLVCVLVVGALRGSCCLRILYDVLNEIDSWS